MIVTTYVNITAAIFFDCLHTTDHQGDEAMARAK